MSLSLFFSSLEISYSTLEVHASIYVKVFSVGLLQFLCCFSPCQVIAFICPSSPQPIVKSAYFTYTCNTPELSRRVCGSVLDLGSKMLIEKSWIMMALLSSIIFFLSFTLDLWHKTNSLQSRSEHCATCNTVIVKLM